MVEFGAILDMSHITKTISHGLIRASSIITVSSVTAKGMRVAIRFIPRTSI